MKTVCWGCCRRLEDERWAMGKVALARVLPLHKEWEGGGFRRRCQKDWGRPRVHVGVTTTHPRAMRFRECSPPQMKGVV